MNEPINESPVTEGEIVKGIVEPGFEPVYPDAPSEVDELRSDCPPRAFVKAEIAAMGLDQARVQSASLVRRPTKRVGSKVFSPVVFPSQDGVAQPKIHAMSQTEAKFLKKFLDTLNVDVACEEVGVSKEVGLRYFKRKHIAAFIEDKMKERALATGLSMDFLKSTIYQVITGEKKLDKAQLEAIKIAARIEAPAAPSQVSVTLNQQNNNFSAGPSPYANLTKEQMLEEMKKTVAESE